MIIFLDTETTGLIPELDEILEIAIINQDGETLLDTLVKPTMNQAWEKAQRIHGITPEMVANAPTITDLKPQILKLLQEAEQVIIYNAGFDIPMLENELEQFLDIGEKTECAMINYAEHIGFWDSRHNSYRWHKLADAAKVAGHNWEGNPHRALADAQACRTVWNWLQQQTPIITCPECEARYEDHDGIGAVVHCVECGYCKHLSSTGIKTQYGMVWKCDYCGEHHRMDIESIIETEEQLKEKQAYLDEIKCEILQFKEKIDQLECIESSLSKQLKNAEYICYKQW